MAARTETIRDIPIHFEEHGEGRPVVLLHGLSREHRHVEHLYEPIFAARHRGAAGWRRIYPDLPGHGRTPAPGWLESDDQMLEIVVGFVDAVTGGARFAIVGESWGGYLGHGLANRRADRVDGLMLAVPGVHAERSTRDLPPQTVIVRDPTVAAEVQPDEELWLQIAVVQTHEMLARSRRPEGTLAVDEAFMERLEPRYAFSFEQELTTRIKAPALIVAGRQDSIVGYRDAWPLLEHLPRATFAVLDRAGHALENEQSGLFTALAAEWLDRVEEHIEDRKTDVSQPRSARGADA